MEVRWAMCECYVWPYAIDFFGGSSIGTCYRCFKPAKKLPYVDSKEQALKIFYETFHHEPDPI